MTALQLRLEGATKFDFDDWPKAPALIAHMVDPQHPDNFKSAVQAHLAEHGVEDINVEEVGTGKFRVTGQVWHKFSISGYPDLKDIYAKVPAEAELTRGTTGELAKTLPMQPDKEAADEVENFIRGLATHGDIEGIAGASTRPTHAIETDGQGRRKLKRKGYKRFSAL